MPNFDSARRAALDHAAHVGASPRSKCIEGKLHNMQSSSFSDISSTSCPAHVAAPLLRLPPPDCVMLAFALMLYWLGEKEVLAGFLSALLISCAR